MSKLSDYRKRSLKNRRDKLLQEYDAVNRQLSNELNEVYRIRFERQAQDLAQEIQQIDQELKQIPPGIIWSLLAFIILSFFIAFLISSNSTSTSTNVRQPSSNSDDVIIAQALLLERRFKVVYPGKDGLNLRAGPDTSCEKIAELRSGTELTVKGEVALGENNLTWWRVSNSDKEGWVAERERNWRLIKPKIMPDDIVEVANPLEEGKVNLRDKDCKDIEEVGRGAKLTIRNGPNTKCDNPNYKTLRNWNGEKMIEEGREWWYVTTSDGKQGWIADFGAVEKNMLIAPKWYLELSKQIASSPDHIECPTFGNNR